MIEKRYLFNNKKENKVVLAVEVPWDKANLSSVICALDDKLCGLSGFYVDEFEPVHYNPETKTFLIEAVVDVEDVDFSEFED